MTTGESLTSEARAWSEYRALLRDPVYRGAGVPPGDGRPVLVLPGLFGNDLYLQPLRTWLRRIGYQPVASNILFNVGCPERIKVHAERSFQKHIEGRGDVAIIGHSRGGLLGKALATRLGPRCTCLVALGSPVGAMMGAGRAGLAAFADGRRAADAEPLAAAAVVDAGRRAMRVFSPNCEFPNCACSYTEELLAPLPATTRVYSIYSSEDPVVAPAASTIAGAVNIEVTGTHSGLVANRAVYRHLGRVLAGMEVP